MDEYFVNAQTKQSTDSTKPKDLTNYFVTYSSRGASTRGELTIYTRREREVRSEKGNFILASSTPFRFFEEALPKA